MKKILLLLVCTLCLTACDKKEEKKEVVKLFAENLITEEKAEELLSTDLVKTTDNDDGYSLVEYYPEDLGSVSPVIVELYSEEGENADSKKKFDERRAKRPSAVKVESIGSDAYIAYPSLVFYRDRYMVVVTAGKGGEKAEDILKKTAKIADENLQGYLNNQ